jgi:hypothetical protein
MSYGYNFMVMVNLGDTPTIREQLAPIDDVPHFLIANIDIGNIKPSGAKAIASN